MHVYLILVQTVLIQSLKLFSSWNWFNPRVQVLPGGNRPACAPLEPWPPSSAVTPTGS